MKQFFKKERENYSMGKNGHGKNINITLILKMWFNIQKMSKLSYVI